MEIVVLGSPPGTGEAFQLAAKGVINESQINTWRHPLRPCALVEKSVHFSNLLLAHFYYAARGLVPLTLDWNDEKHKELVSHDTTIITSIQTLQQYAKTLSKRSYTPLSRYRLIRYTEEGLAVGQKGRDRYQEKDESSLDFTLSSLVLVDTVQSYARVKDFF